MTTSQRIEPVGRPVRVAHRLLASLPQLALAALLVLLLAGVWLAFFTFVPLDFTPPRPR